VKVESGNRKWKQKVEARSENRKQKQEVEAGIGSKK
jgi:hypothetical protein